MEKKGLFLGKWGLPSAPSGTERASVTDLAPARTIQAQCHGWRHHGPIFGLCFFFLFSKFLASLSRMWGGERVWEKSTADSDHGGVSKLEQFHPEEPSSPLAGEVGWGWKAPGLPLGQKTNTDHFANPHRVGEAPGGRRTGALWRAQHGLSSRRPWRGEGTRRAVRLGCCREERRQKGQSPRAQPENAPGNAGVVTAQGVSRCLVQLLFHRPMTESGFHLFFGSS